jgi:hypothetical protein
MRLTKYARDRYKAVLEAGTPGPELDHARAAIQADDMSKVVADDRKRNARLLKLERMELLTPDHVTEAWAERVADVERLAAAAGIPPEDMAANLDAVASAVTAEAAAKAERDRARTGTVVRARVRTDDGENWTRADRPAAWVSSAPRAELERLAAGPAGEVAAVLAAALGYLPPAPSVLAAMPGMTDAERETIWEDAAPRACIVAMAAWSGDWVTVQRTGRMRHAQPLTDPDGTPIVETSPDRAVMGTDDHGRPRPEPSSVTGQDARYVVTVRPHGTGYECFIGDHTAQLAGLAELAELAESLRPELAPVKTPRVFPSPVHASRSMQWAGATGTDHAGPSRASRDARELGPDALAVMAEDARKTQRRKAVRTEVERREADRLKKQRKRDRAAAADIVAAAAGDKDAARRIEYRNRCAAGRAANDAAAAEAVRAAEAKAQRAARKAEADRKAAAMAEAEAKAGPGGDPFAVPVVAGGKAAADGLRRARNRDRKR